MDKNIQFSEKEVEEIYAFLEAANHLFHQPLYYRDANTVEQFAQDQYPTIKRLYYSVLWEKLPEATRGAVLKS